ncbi:LysE family transporter [Paenisporosarcina sp. TG20]|uniref:LysE family transporter n=1 Tax=Paenisporosarcina sp. TG20 TaxID=1211706 RepID=UPI0002E74D18|nr:LysE family transporter [Paenisporosarcina sp. TG20]
MNSIFTYIFLGISLAAPLGPVKAMLLNTGIKNGFFHAWLFSFGALATDILYMVLVYFGVAQFIDTPFMKTLLWSFGCFVLTYTGIENLLSLNKIKMDLNFTKYVRLRHSLVSGFLMALLNPITILFWLGIYGSILVKSTESVTGIQIIVSSMAILVGIMLWDFILAFISGKGRKFLSTTLLKIVSILSSISMIGFGVYFGIQAYHSLL